MKPSLPELLFLRKRNCVAEIHRTSAFTYVIPVPIGNFHCYIARDHRLAAEPRVQRHAGGLVHAIHLVVLGLAQIRVPLFDDDVACRTGAAAAAGMFEVNPMIEADVEERALETVFGIGHSIGIVVDGYAEWKYRDLMRH